MDSTLEPKSTSTTTGTGKEGSVQVEGRQDPVETGGGRVEGKRMQRVMQGPQGGQGHQATLVGTHLVTETNRLPSALVAVPSLSKLKKQRKDNREQLVTSKN